MSYILDALKKSEQERHRGQVPDLISQQPLWHLQHEHKSSGWLRVLVILLILNLVAVIAWLVWDRDTLFQPQTVHDLVTQELVASEKYSEVKGTVQRAPVTVVDSQVYSVAVGHANQQNIEPIIELEEDLNTGADYSVETPKAQAAMHQQVINPGRLAPQIPLTTNEGAIISETALDGVEETEVKSVDNDVYLSESTVPFLIDLPSDERIQIPSLTFNSHVYSPEASASRVLINGIYLRNGDQLGELTIEHIAENSVIFRKGQYLFKLGALTDWNGEK